MSRGFAVATFGATAAAAVLVSVGLGTRSVWFDEAFSITTSWNGIGPVLTTFWNGDPAMVLYHVLLAAWIPIVGTSETAIRALSACLFVATVPTTALLGRALGGPRTGAVAAWLMAVHPFALRYGQEARGYALALWIVTAAALALTTALRTRAWAAWLLWAFLAGAAPYAHTFAALVVAVAVFIALVDGTDRPKLVSATALATLMMLPLVIASAERGPGQLSWIPTPNGAALARLAGNLLGDAGGFGIAAWGEAVLAGLAAFARHDRRNAGWLAAWALVPPLAIFVLSQWIPLFWPRYFLPMLPAIVVLAARGAAALSSARMTTVAAVLLVATTAPGLHRLHVRGNLQDWRGAMQWLAERARPDDGIVPFVFLGAPSIAYYRSRLPNLQGVTTIDLAPPGFIAGALISDFAADRLAAATDHHQRLWLVESWASGRARATRDAVRAQLERSHGPGPTATFTAVTVRAYDRRLPR